MSRRSLSVMALGLALCGCVSFERSRAARFYALRAVLDAPTEAPAPETNVRLGVLAVRLPAALDRPQLVRWAGSSELRLDEHARWAEPLAEGVGRALAHDLAALRRDVHVVRAPWPASAAVSCRLSVELRVFGLQPDGGTQLSGEMALLAPGEERVWLRRTFRETGRPLGRAADAGLVVDAMSDLVAELAKEIAGTLGTCAAGGER